ncbi:MAG: carboxypeptidase-like regulatory domain-containing protein, partial [Acidobacteriota bacterium]|nr:carboxypeptidase-like regulatory domain-containing protein [Acidobacteriota bacterium]
NKADIVGIVSDSNGAAVKDATITATRVDTGATREATSDDSGNYQLPLLDIGIYKISATKPGFQTVTQENVTVQTQDRLRIDLTLTPGNVTGQVTVTAEAPLVETETSDRGTVITGRQVTELPLSGRQLYPACDFDAGRCARQQRRPGRWARSSFFQQWRSSCR